MYVKAPSSEPLSVLIKNDGSYLLPMQTILSEDLSSYALVPPSATVTLLIVSHNEKEWEQYADRVWLLKNKDILPIL